MGSGRIIHFAYFVGHVSSDADVPTGTLSESQNRLLNNDQHTNNTRDHLTDNDLESGELYEAKIIYKQN